MPEMFLYEYAVIRLVPQVEREEFINVGIIIFSKKEKFIRAKIVLPQVKANLRAFELISSGSKEGGPIACEELPERFRWLTAVRSSIIQTSRPHPGKTNDLEKEVERLFVEYVG